jgi:uncharacterized protein (TIGR03790 family)
MAKIAIACRKWRLVAWSVFALVCGQPAHGENASAPPLPPSAAFGSRARPAMIPRWISVPRAVGRLTPKDLGLVVNTADPYSVEVGEFYAASRRLTPEQVLRVELPVKAVLTPEEFRSLQGQIAGHFGAATQALALAWTVPFAVNCNSITAAVTLGYDAGLCSQTCAPSRLSPYFNAATSRPYTDLRLRPAMLLAAKDVATAKSLIERGVQSDHSLGLRGGLPAKAYFIVTQDRARGVRAALYPPPGLSRGAGIEVRVETTQALEDVDRVLLYETGLSQVDKLDRVKWVPGALADHLTSFGGRLDGKGGQMNALDWISSGATATYGTVSEPCSHPQKFPHPQVLLLHYLQGSTAIEAYWKSVAWPQQGVFVGEPLAAPFSRR